MPRNSTLASVEIDVAEKPREIARPEPEEPLSVRICVGGPFMYARQAKEAVETAIEAAVRPN